MIWQNFRHIQGATRSTFTPRRRYSVTSDILSFRRCSRQYGFESEYGYEPSRTSQLFYGTIVHQVLDRAHAHYGGLLDSSTTGSLPNDNDIESYFREVHASLRARGVRGARIEVEEQALKVLQLFNRVEGPELYPRVVDTEHRMQSDQDKFVLHGTVDVLAQNIGADQSFESLEIWDYKGLRRPQDNDPRMNDLRFQMLVYASLYFERHGVYPSVANLYFLNELMDESRTIAERRERALLPVQIDPSEVEIALTAFHGTVSDIESCRSSQSWPAPSVGDGPGEETCTACDHRWNCPTVREDSYLAGRMPLRYP